jgi:predicted DNA-binding protein
MPRNITQQKSNWDGRTNGYAQKRKKETSSNWDGQLCQETLHEKHPIRMETDMTKKYYIRRNIQSGWTDMTKYYIIRNIQRV